MFDSAALCVAKHSSIYSWGIASPLGKGCGDAMRPEDLKRMVQVLAICAAHALRPNAIATGITI